MAGLELRKGTTDIVVNDLPPGHRRAARTDPRSQTHAVARRGLSVHRPQHARSRPEGRARASGHRLRDRPPGDHRLPAPRAGDSGDGHPAADVVGLRSDAFAFYATIPRRARALLDEAGYPDPDGDGPATRLRLTLKMSSIEFNRLQGAVDPAEPARGRHRPRRPQLRVRDAVRRRRSNGNFQMYMLQWTGGARRRPGHPPARLPLQSGAAGRASTAATSAIRASIALLDEATTLDRRRHGGARSSTRRSALIAEQAPYISLWCKTNIVVAQRDLGGIHPLPDRRLRVSQGRRVARLTARHESRRDETAV